ERVDVELPQFGVFGYQLGKADQHVYDSIALNWRLISIPRHQPRHLGSCDLRACEVDVQRWKLDRSVIANLDRDAALTEHNHRAEQHILGHAGKQFDGARSEEHT